MNRFALTALTATLFAASSTLAVAQSEAKEELMETQPQAKTEAAETGEVEATMEKEGAPTGTEGEAASLVDEGATPEKESNVESASELTEDKGEPASTTQ